MKHEPTAAALALLVRGDGDIAVMAVPAGRRRAGLSPLSFKRARAAPGNRCTRPHLAGV